jgi:hypothetical protein
MNEKLKSAADQILQRVVSGSPQVPGVVAIAADQHPQKKYGRDRRPLRGGAAAQYGGSGWGG